MKPIKEMSIGELGAFVCTHLEKNQISCTLSGGACVSIYSKNRYQSYDLDFIEKLSSTRKRKREVMALINFYEEGRYFKNDETSYIIEFPAGPLGIGEEIINDFQQIVFETGELKMLTPTDCVKDRLAAFYHWDDKQCLEQAIMVAVAQKIDYENIKSWSKKERSLKKFNLFIKSLKIF